MALFGLLRSPSPVNIGLYQHSGVFRSSFQSFGVLLPAEAEVAPSCDDDGAHDVMLRHWLLQRLKRGTTGFGYY